MAFHSRIMDDGLYNIYLTFSYIHRKGPWLWWTKNYA